MRIINIKSINQMSLALIVSILFIAGCDNISVIGDKDNDGDTVPR